MGATFLLQAPDFAVPEARDSTFKACSVAGSPLGSVPFIQDGYSTRGEAPESAHTPLVLGSYLPSLDLWFFTWKPGLVRALPTVGAGGMELPCT